MLTLHGRAYHRMFDLQQHYTDMNVSNSSRFYIYDSDFNSQAASLKLDTQIAHTLRKHVNSNIPWAQQYRSAVGFINRASAGDDNTPFKEFAQVSRAHDGPNVGDPVSAPEIAALLYTSNSQNPEPRNSGHLPKK